MNRRSFLKFCGIAPVAPKLASDLLTESTQINATGQLMFRALESGKKGDVIACVAWDQDQSDPINDMETAMKILERTNRNNPRHYAVSPGEWKILKDLELIA